MSDRPDPRGLLHHGTIREVRGRALGRGVPEAFTISLQTAGGDVINAGMPMPGGMVAVQGRDLYEIRGPAERFERCPICLCENPSSREHVPPHAIGGQVLIYTCERCNNDFGRSEADLSRWYRGAVQLRIRSKDVRGHRNVGDVLVRPTSSGQVLLMTTSDVPEETLAIFESGTGRVFAAEPDVARIQASIAKSAYLTACIFLGEIPDTPRARAFRAELVAARDTPRRQPLQLGPTISSLRVHRGPQEPATGRLSLTMVPRLAPHQYWIGWNDSVFVEWPLESELLGPWLEPLDEWNEGDAGEGDGSRAV